MYAWAGAVALTVFAGVWAATNQRSVRPVLPLEHVAAAALIGSFAWDMLVQLPGSIMGVWTLTAGLGDVLGDEPQQAFVAAQVLFVAAGALAVPGILRRRVWGIVLGIGLSVALMLWAILSVVHLVARIGQGMPPDVITSILVNAIGLSVIPALAAIGLLAWPLRRTTPRRTEADADRDWSVSAAPDPTR
jgi:hypothetical protein